MIGDKRLWKSVRYRRWGNLRTKDCEEEYDTEDEKNLRTEDCEKKYDTEHKEI